MYIIGPLCGGPIGGLIWQVVGLKGGPAMRPDAALSERQIEAEMLA